MVFVINRLGRLIMKQKGMEESASSDISRPRRCPA